MRIDPFVLLLLASVAAASLLPAQGNFAIAVGRLADAGIAFLFFLQGAKLSRAAIVSGLTAWRVHLLVLAATFVAFPLIGLLVGKLAQGLVQDGLVAGLLFLCLLPSTVQSSIALTAIARGNVPAAVCGASLSNVIGVFLTPLLATFFFANLSSGSGPPVSDVVVQLLVPFALGHLARPWLKGPLSRRPTMVGIVDRGSILLVVYTAFSASVVGGMWHRLPVAELLIVVAFVLLIFAVVVGLLVFASRRLGYRIEDEVVIVLCGSQKSLVSGVPIAGILFPHALIGPILLPLILFHQVELMLGAVIASRYRQRRDPDPDAISPLPGTSQETGL